MPYKCVKNLFASIVNIYRADGEVESGSATTTRPTPISSTLASAVATLSASIMSRQTATRAGEEQIVQLIEMGFPRASAENALNRLGNSVQRAAEYLLLHPEAALVESTESPVENTDPEFAMDEDDDEDEHYETDDSEEKVDDMAIDPPNPDIAMNKNQLEVLRKDLESDIVSVALTVMDKLTDIAPEVKDIIILKGKDSLDQVVADLVSDQVKKLKETPDVNGKKLANRLRILALLINDPALISKTLKISKTLTLDLLDLLDVFDVTKTDNEDILSSMLVIIEAYLSLSEEPKSSVLKFPLDIAKQPEENTDELPPLSLAQKEVILSSLLKKLRNATPGKELLNAILRLIVHLTKTVDIARSLVESDGLALLLQKESLGSFAAQQSFLVMIFRHLLESHTVLQNYINQDIQSWLSVPRPRVVDMNAYIKHGGYMVCREPQIFVEATKKLCSLTKYESSIRSLQVTAKQDVVEEKKEESTVELLGSTDLSQAVAGFLIKFLLDCQSLPQDEAEPTSLRTAHSVHIAKCTAMQLIAELVSSYPFFKVDLVNMSSKKGKLSTPHRLKNSFFNYLLNELLPVKPNMDDKLETPEKKKLAEATWAGSVITAMCCSTTKSNDDSLDVSMKKSVVDSIIRTMKDTIGSDEKLDSKYSKYFSISTLIGRIMNFKSVESHVENPSADVTLSLAKIMLEKKHG
jgi:E3 ubiquitin-protein ligase HUWE1